MRTVIFDSAASKWEKAVLPETISTGESVWEDGNPLLHGRATDKEMGSGIHLWGKDDREYRTGNRT
mgnify:CR=1 FL=1